MNDDLNSSRPRNLPEDALFRAFEELIEGRSSHAATPREDAPAGTPAGRPEPSSHSGACLLSFGGEADLADAANLDALLAHAAECSRCAERLRTVFAEASPEEAVQVGELESAHSDWQHELAAQLALTSHRTPHIGQGIRLVSNRPARKLTQRRYVWAAAGLAASLLLAVGLTAWWRLANTPEQLLAEAYTHSRVFDLRMTGAGFAEVTAEAHLRGSATGREQASLLDARARIERHLESAPNDPHWLQLEGRADLLEEKFDPAIDILDRLLADGPVTSGLLVDAASAYFQRGAATGSENDRATALEYLRHADELAPDDPVVLFNEAVVMEDRGQLMNAVETWNRYLHFERDSRWLGDGRRRLQALELKLNQLKGHQSRMDQRLATPQAMRALAADPASLAAFDEELSSYILPRLLDTAFPMPVDRSRGSPCEERCLAARTLLHAIADSLQRNHRDPWLTQLLPADSSAPDPQFVQAANALAQAMDADVLGDYIAGRQSAAQASSLFRSLGNAAGEDRAEIERSFALLRTSDLPGCYLAAHPVLGRDPQFAWIQIYDLLQDTLCDPSPGTATEDNPSFLRAVGLAHDLHYSMLEIRARNQLGSAAVDAGDSEASWRIYLPTIRGFYSGDFPPMRLYGALSGLQQVEQSTPRVRLALSMQREVVHVLELTESRQLIATERFNLAAAAIRAGAIDEAQQQMRVAQSELAANGGGKSVHGLLAENEIAMADLYLERRDLAAAARMLEAADGHMAGEDNSYHRRDYAVALGQLELAEAKPETAEPLLRDALIEEERLAGKAGAASIVLAQQDRDLYAILAGVWVAQGRSGVDVLALWERYRLRILGIPAPVCPDKGLACLQPRLTSALNRLGPDQVLGQVVLLDRLLLYRASAAGVAWTSVPVRREELLAAAASLERAVSSPATPMDSIDKAALRVGALMVDPLVQIGQLEQVGQVDSIKPSLGSGGQLLLEADPVLGNLPWPSVETTAGPIGLRFDLEESPSLALDRGPVTRGAQVTGSTSAKPTGQPLVVGASVASSGSSSSTEGQLLPEVLVEARAVARFDDAPNLLLGDQATQGQVAARLAKASAIHFAGHAAQQAGSTRLLLAPKKATPIGIGLAAANPGKLALDHPYLDSDLLRKHPPKAVRLAVFSACSTGKKEEGWNHGMGDIVGTLASLGVPDVVATRWQIDSASAVPMMDAFYGGLAKGLSVPQALTIARQSLIRDPRYRHPYYWAAWYASGFGRSDLSQIFHDRRQ
jgi:tetratricopeptide (TPR) repeat protein